MPAVRSSESLTGSQCVSDLQAAYGRLERLEQGICQANYFLSQALECRSDGEIRKAIARMAHATLQGAMHHSH